MNTPKNIALELFATASIFMAGAGCEGKSKAAPIAVPPAATSTETVTDSTRRFLQGAFPDAPEIQEFCSRSLEDPSPSVGGSLTEESEQWRVLRSQGGLGEEYTACTGEELSAGRIGTETEVCDNHENCAVLDKQFGQPLSGTFIGKDGSLKRNPVGEIAYKRAPAAEVDGLRTEAAKVPALQADNQAKAAEITRLQGEIATLQGRITTLEGDISRLRGEVDQLKRELEEKNRRIIELQTQLETCQRNCSNPEELSARQDTVRVARQSADTTRRILRQKETQLATPEAERTKWELEKLQAQQRIRFLETDQTYLGTGAPAGEDAGEDNFKNPYDLSPSASDDEGVTTFGLE